MHVVTVRVPASTSNLGPGFDCLGVALRFYNWITVARGGANSRVLYEPGPFIVDEAARLFFKHAGVRPFRFSCSVKGKVPRARGLGSSATARIGILCGLNQLARNPLDQMSIFHLCAQLEGHPDNAAPACFGGFTVAGRGRVQKFDVSPRLRFVLLIPNHEVKTSVARKILPARIFLTSSIENCGHACAITAAFAGRKYPELKGHFVDHFHQPFRQKLIPFLPRVIAAAEKAGALGAFLSGSGSTIAAVTLESPQKIAKAMLRAAGKISVKTLIVSADNEGAHVSIANRKS